MPVFLDFWDKLRGYKWDQFSLNLIFSKHCILLGGTIVLYAIVFSITNVSIIYIINKIANMKTYILVKQLQPELTKHSPNY